MKLPTLLSGFMLAAAAAAGAPPLGAVGGTDASGRTVEEITAGTPAVVLLTSPRVASVGTQLRLLRFLAHELGEAVAPVAVIYGEKPETLAKLREGMPFSVVAGAGAVPWETLGEEGKLPQALLVNRKGKIIDRLKDVPDPLAAAEILQVKYDPGPPGPPKGDDILPDLILAGSDGRAHNLRAALKKPKAVLFVFNLADENRRRYLPALQHLADDLGDELDVTPVILDASTAAVVKLAEAEYMDVPVLAGGPLAARRLAGELDLPVLIVTGKKGLVVGAKEKAAVPTRLEIVAAESAPATEGPPVTLEVTRLGRLTQGLRYGVIPTPAFDAGGRFVIFSGYFEPGGADHLWEITAAGKDLRQISYAAAPDAAPSCSADNVHLAFVSGRSGGNEIWICERLRGEFTQLTKSDGTYRAPSYSPDGQWLVAPRRVQAGEEENYDLWLLTSRGRRARPVAETFYDEVEPAFGTRGDRIFLASNRYDNWDVVSWDLRGGKRRRLTGPETEDRMPAPSPDGTYVVFASRAEDQPYKLWAMNVDGSSKTPLTSGPGNDLYPRFARDGRALVFVSDRTGSFEIYKMKFEPTPDYDLPRPPRPLARFGRS